MAAGMLPQPLTHDEVLAAGAASAQAFEALKKVEHVAELARLQQAKAELRIENAALDEIALRDSHRARELKRRG